MIFLNMKYIDKTNKYVHKKLKILKIQNTTNSNDGPLTIELLIETFLIKFVVTFKTCNAVF